MGAVLLLVFLFCCHWISVFCSCPSGGEYIPPNDPSRLCDCVSHVVSNQTVYECPPEPCSSACIIDDSCKCPGYQCDSHLPDCGLASGCPGPDFSPDPGPCHCSGVAWGDWCEHYCPVNCAFTSGCTVMAGKCAGFSGNNSAPDDGPAIHCFVLYWGDWCEHYCPTTCAIPGCTVGAGKCVGFEGNSSLPDWGPAKHCIAGTWGDWCQHSCPSNCSTPACTTNNGKCLGYDGDPCQSDLGPASGCTANQTCHCKGSSWGDECQHSCPATCARPGCTVNNGKCNGYDDCSSASPVNSCSQYPASHCLPGTWGDSCSHTCPPSCPTACSVSGACLSPSIRDSRFAQLNNNTASRFLDLPATSMPATSGCCASQCVPHHYQFPASQSPKCGAWVLWRLVSGSSEFIHQAFGYSTSWTPTSHAIPAVTVTSGYYCNPNPTFQQQRQQLEQADHHGVNGSGPCGAFQSGVGVVCSDPPSAYTILNSTAGLSSVFPSEQDKTCWFSDPTKGEALRCDVLWAAEMQVQGNWNSCQNHSVPEYDLLSHNCRHYVMQVMQVYCSMAGSSNPACTC
eukprot:c11765_g1_i1.p1 GENE.c11765_g1_i1~~c11765_g1_i1.p1  ORF type:complete len:578 (+),score=108.64 c11765_g1_i1:38-1735(+)